MFYNNSYFFRFSHAFCLRVLNNSLFTIRSDVIIHYTVEQTIFK